MIQDKFIDSYIEDIYDINEEKNNFFWIRGNKGDSKYLNTTKTIEYIGNNKTEILDRLKCIDKNDCVFVHWYDSFIADILMNIENRLFVMMWGGEFYELPELYHSKWVLDNLTYKKFKYPEHPQKQKSLNPIKILKRLNWKKKLKKNLPEEYEKRNNQIGRIDYLVCMEDDNEEIKKINSLFPKFKAKHVFGFYDQNLNLSVKNKKDTRTALGSVNILFGNSATESNNHLDAFTILQKMNNVNIYCPLSYGSDKYKKYIIKEGYKFFRKKFFPIIDFQSKEDYVKLLNKMDVLVMFHNRQQALGNMIIGMGLGKPVFIKDNNVLKTYFNKIGVTTFSSDKISIESIKEAILISENNKTTNIEILNSKLSRDVRLSNLKNLMTNYAK